MFSGTVHNWELLKKYGKRDDKIFNMVKYVQAEIKQKKEIVSKENRKKFLS